MSPTPSVQSPAFVGRQQELRLLRDELDRDRSSLIVVYGRRRVGKSTLLAQAIAGRAHSIYFQATQVLGSTNLAMLKEAIQGAGDAPDPVLDGIQEWEALLSYIAGLAAERPGLTLVLDEFPYLCESIEALPSIIQKVYDRTVQRGLRFNLILCGSQISFMEELLGEKNPLRGRQTHELELPPLTYREVARFFPSWSLEDQLMAYGVFGGLPYYLQLSDPARSLRENIEAVVLQPGAPLSNEALNVLRAELNSPSRYASILEAIANGCTTTGDILGRVKDISGGGALAPYIAKLEALRLIRITRSLDAPAKARNRRYAIADPFLAFWYRFVLPNRSALATGRTKEVYDSAIAPHLDGYMGELFEWIAHEYIAHYSAELRMAPAREVGKIWSADYGIDLAAVLIDNTALFGECKWWSSPVGANVLKRLRDSAAATSFERGAANKRFILFARSGFTTDLVHTAEEDATVDVVGPRALLGLPEGPG